MKKIENRGNEETMKLLKKEDKLYCKLTHLSHAKTRAEINRQLPSFLKLLCEYVNASGAYLLRYDNFNKEYLRKSHWIKDETREVEKYFKVQQDDITDIHNQLLREEIVELKEDKKMIIPIFMNLELGGCICIVDVDDTNKNISKWLLLSTSSHLGIIISNMNAKAQVKKKHDELKKETEQQEKLEKALNVANLNYEIISAISKLYWLIYRMDLENDTFEEITNQGELHKLTGKKGSISVDFKETREHVVSPEYQEYMKNFLDVTTLSERLKDRDTIAAEYMSSSENWHMARFIVKKRDANNKVTNVLYLVRDINEQKVQEYEYKQKLIRTAEEARRANIAKTDFLRRMSHDIRTPINGILGMIKIAEHYENDSEKQSECLHKVKEATGFLLQLVNDVLDMNKLESGEVKLEEKPFNILEILMSVDNILQMQCEEQAIKLNFVHSDIEHINLIGSPIHIQQILQNITSNAVKYNKEKGNIDVSTKELFNNGEMAYFEFVCTDTGIGMSEEFQKHAFETFSQENRTARTVYSGTGLGLAICKELVEKMGGIVELKSELNVGTTFTITIPFKIDLQAHQNIASSDENIELATLKGKKVMLVEDNELNMEIAKFLLENEDMEVVHCWNGKEAVETFENSKDYEFDIILMDIMMPIMGGLEATRTIRGLNKTDAKTIPVFAMSANAFSDDITQSMEAGMNGHFSKPLEPEKLIKALKVYLGKLDK